MFLTSEDDESGAATLIASKGIYEEGRLLSIDLEDEQIQVYARRLVFSGPVFDRFEFSYE